MREEIGSPRVSTNKFREYLYRLAQVESVEQLTPLGAELQKEDQASFGKPYFLKFLILYIELRKLDLKSYDSFSSEILWDLIHRIHGVMRQAAKTAEETNQVKITEAEASAQHAMDADEFEFFSLQIHLMILRFQANFLKYKNNYSPTRENFGLLIPPVSIHDLLEEAYLIQEELGVTFIRFKGEANRSLLKNSQHQATHTPDDDQAYFKMFNDGISNLWAWGFYQFDREFSKVLEWAYESSSQENSLELKEHFLSLLMHRRYPYSQPKLTQVFKGHKFSYTLLNRTSDNSKRFELFWGDFEKLRKKLSCHAIQYTIGYNGKSYDPEYLSLIREFFRLHFQFQMWKQFHSNEKFENFSNENRMRILILGHSTEAILGVYLWHSKIELMNLFRAEVYFKLTLKRILAILNENESFRFSGPGVLDLLLSTILHKMLLEFQVVVSDRRDCHVPRISGDNPFAEDYVLPNDIRLEETFRYFIQIIKGRFKIAKEGDFFYDVANIFCQFYAFKLGDKRTSLKGLQDLLASKMKPTKENKSERDLILAFFCKYFHWQSLEKPDLRNANELLSSYSELWKFLEDKTPSLLMTLGVLEDYFSPFLQKNKIYMMQGNAKRFLKKVEDSRQILLQRCRSEFVSSESAGNKKKESPKGSRAAGALKKNENSKEPKAEKVSKKKAAAPQAQLKSTTTALAKISPQEKYLAEYEKATAPCDKITALVGLVRASESLNDAEKWATDFFRLLILENEPIRSQTQEMMTLLASRKWIPLPKKSTLTKLVLECLKAFFKRNRFEDLKDEAEKVDSILSLIHQLQILASLPKESSFMEEMKQWFECFLESVARTPGLNLSVQIQSILQKLNEFNIFPFSRKITISPDFFRRVKNSSAVIDFFIEKKVPVYIFGGATRDFIVEQNRPKKERVNKIIPEDLDIFVGLNKEDLLACLRAHFGQDACQVIGGEKSYYIKMAFADVDVISLGEDTSEPPVLALLKKTDAFDFDINCGIYSVQDNIYYSFRNAFESIRDRKFRFFSPLNHQSDEPKHIFRTMNLLAKYLPVSLELALSDQEVYFEKLALLNTRWVGKAYQHSDLSESERKLVNNAFLKLYCGGKARFSFSVCKKYGSLTVLFPSLISFLGSEQGAAYLEKCCQLADIVLNQNDGRLKKAHFSFRIGYLLSLFFYQPIMQENNQSSFSETLRYHVQSCLFWTHFDTARFVGDNITQATRQNLSIFQVSESWLENKHRECAQKIEVTEALSM